MANFPDSVSEKPNFAIYMYNRPTEPFSPMYYPRRITLTTEKKLNRTKAGSYGERVTIKKLKNSDVSIEGRIHSSDLDRLKKLAETTDPVEIHAPVFESGAFTAVVKKVQRGEVVGWDQYEKAQEWLIEYKIDLVSTGHQEYLTESEATFDLVD